MKPRLYHDLAWLFPILTPVENYQEEGKFFIRKISEHHSGSPETLLDLGCGRGHTHHYMLDRFKVTGIDISPEMLKLAAELNPDVDYHLGDMRNARLGKEFDVVTIFDGITYITTRDDLASTFETAFTHLKPGGLLLTYVEDEPEKFVQNETVTKQHTSDGINFTYITNKYDPDTSDNEYEHTFVYLTRKGGGLDVQTDVHRFGIFHLDTWVELLENAGFRVIRDIFEHSEFSPGEELPLLIGIK